MQEDQITQLTQQLAHVNSEHYHLQQQATQKTLELQQTLENQINYDYLKHVLVEYFVTTDASVHANLLRVVFQCMRFSPEEQEKVTDAFNLNN